MNATEITTTWEFGGPLAGMPSDVASAILLGTVVFGALVWWLSYRFAVQRLSVPKRALLVALRTTVLAALLLCLANPVRIEKITAEPPPAPPPPGPSGKLAVVVDRSGSMTTPDNRGRTRLDDALATWRRFEPAARPVYSSTHYFSFAKDLQAAATLDEALARTAETGETRLYDALVTLLKKAPGERPDTIVVLTDGLDTTHESETGFRDVAQAAGVPVHFVSGTNRDRPEPFLRVREWRAPTSVLRNSEFAIETSVEAFSREDRKVPYSVWRGDLRMESGVLALTTGSNLVPLSFRVLAGEPGLIDLSFRLGEGPAAQVMARSETVVLGRRPIGVLVFQGALDWGFRYLGDALRTDSSFVLITVVNPGIGITITNDPRPGGTMVARMPVDSKQLARFDCVVLTHLTPRHLNEAQQQALVEFARDGGSVLFSSPDAVALSEFAGSKLADLLPVELAPVSQTVARWKRDPSAGRARGSGGSQEDGKANLRTFTLTEAGKNSPIFARKDAAGPGWLLPRFRDHAPAFPAKPGAEILAVHPTARDETTGQPHILLAMETYGRGRTALLASDGLWRWKMNEPADSRIVETFWQQLLLAIGRRAEPEQIHFVTTPPQLSLDETVTLRIGGVGPHRPPAVGAKQPDGRIVRVTCRATGDAADPWSFSWKADQAGPWVFVASLGDGVRAYYFANVVAEPTGELARSPTAVEHLRNLAAITGGLLLTDKPPLAWRVDTKSDQTLEPVTTERRRPRWNDWPVLWTALGAFGLELILRRFWKLL